MDKVLVTLKALMITSVMIFVASFLFKHREILTMGEMAGIVSIGVGATFYVGNDDSLEDKE